MSEHGKKYLFSKEKFLLSHALYYKNNSILRVSIDRMDGEEVIGGVCCGYGLIPLSWCNEVKHESSLRRYVRQILEKNREETR